MPSKVGPLNSGALYVLIVLIWGSTWLGIKYQLRVPLRDHPFMLFQGLFLFCSNYYLIYLSEQVLTSGLAPMVGGNWLVMRGAKG